MGDSNNNSKITAKVGETVKQEITDVSSVAKAGIGSGAYLYPFRVSIRHGCRITSSYLLISHQGHLLPIHSSQLVEAPCQ